MSVYLFGLHPGHLTKRAAQIAARHGATHTNFTEPNGQQRGWFSCPNHGFPFDQAIAEAVLADIKAAGGVEALTQKR